jgi:hypothetical protein
VSRHKRPHESAEQYLAKVPLRRIKYRSVNEFGNHHPYPPSQPKSEEGKEIYPNVQKQPVQFDAQDHGYES